MATLDRRVPAHDCFSELKELDRRYPNLGAGSRATCSCGKKWYLPHSMLQAINQAFIGTRWARVDLLEKEPDTL